jgi:hypothetical protein
MRTRRFLKVLLRYGVVFYAGWLAAFFSAVVANKGIDKMNIVVDTDRGSSR